MNTKATMTTKYLNQTDCESAAEKVGSNDDLITEILINLPASSLLGFKSVSKQWLSLITSPHLSLLHIRCPLRVSGLFILIDQAHPQYKYIPLNSSSPSRTFTFPSPTGTGLRILQSSNGLFFCTSTYNNGLREYYVYNPTTCNITTIPLPQLLPGNIRSILDYCILAFDPSSSPHYKLVIVHWHEFDKYQMVVYSSETQLWKVCGDRPFKDPFLGNGVYSNGAILYKSFNHTSCFYLKIDEEQLETTPITDSNRCIYFGQSGGRFHLITTSTDRQYSDNVVFDVYEMEKDCSKWFVKYQIDLRGKVYGFNKIMCIVCGEREEDSFLVFDTRRAGNNRFMKYKFADKSLKMLFEIGRAPGQLHYVASNCFHQSEAFEFIQSLSHV